MNIFFFIVLNFIFILTVSAQEKTLRVVSESGLVRVKNAGDPNWKEVHVNDSYAISSKLRVGLNSYLCLVDSSLNTYEIRETGDYELKLVDSLLTSKNNTINKKIKSFFLHEILTNKQKFKEMHVLASVIRSGNNKIDTPLPTNSIVYSIPLQLRWFPYLEEKTYLLYLLNDKNQLINMQEVSDTIFSVDENTIKLAPQKTFKWFVQSINDPNVISDTLLIRTLSELKKEEIDDHIAVLEADFLNSDSPLNNLLLAKYFESENIFSEAEKYYHASIDLAPNTILYWYEYVQFLARNNIYHKIEETLENSPFKRDDGNEE